MQKSATPGDSEPLTWVKAKASSGEGACVEIARRPGQALVRDSKDPDGAILTFTADAFAAFLTDLTADRLT